MADKSSVSSLKLHPLAIINISDHHTRSAAQEGRAVEVFGALFGTQSGREVEILNSFEVPVALEGGAHVVDKAFVEQRMALFKEVFKTLDFLGWYTTAPALAPHHYDIQQQMAAFVEMPLLLMLGVAGPAGAELPVAVFEPFLDDIVGQKQQMHFAPVPFDIANEEAERIGIEHVAQMMSAGAGATSEATAHLTGQYNAIGMLHARVARLRAYIAAVAQGTIPPAHAALRAIRGLLSRLPVVDAPGFTADTMRATNDVLLMAYLATLTKGCNAMNEMIDRVAILRRPRFQ